MNKATELSRPGLSPTVPMPRMRATPAPASDEVDETSFRGHRGNGERHVAERLVAAGRGDDDRRIILP
jgi:hypothetical protein